MGSRAIQPWHSQFDSANRPDECNGRFSAREQSCEVPVKTNETSDLDELIEFMLEANRNTYAALDNEVYSVRFDSHDFRYEKGNYFYHIIYVG